MPPKTKKRRTTAGSSAEPTANALDRSMWPGWCELESEPAFFNVMLHDMGVQGVTIREVLSLDDEILEEVPKPIHGLIFLFRYRDVHDLVPEAGCPDHVWFANQVPSYSCATVALLNMVNNIPGLDLGTHLQSFKDYTSTFDPLSRGDAIGSFDFVKNIHNSFARDLDILNVDMRLKEKFDSESKKRRVSAAKAKREASKPVKDEGGLRRSARTPKPRVLDDQIEGDNDAEDSSGFHFIAYMPIGENVWKMDGLESFPQDLGPAGSGNDWLRNIVKPVLQARMADYEQGQIEFSLMAMVQDPLVGARRVLAENIRGTLACNAWLDKMAPEQGERFDLQTSDNERGSDVVTGMSNEYGVSQANIDACDQPQNIEDLFPASTHEQKVENVISHRNAIALAQEDCCHMVRREMQNREADIRKAALRRHDYRPFFTEWIKALKDSDVLETLKEKIRANA